MDYFGINFNDKIDLSDIFKKNNKMASANSIEPSDDRVSTYNELMGLIKQIQPNGLTPVVFLMIGSFPGFASKRQHEKPTFLRELIRDFPFINPYVILIDPHYTKKAPIKCTEGHWLIDPTYNSKVSFCYLASIVEDNVVSKVVSTISNHMNMSVAVWSFTGMNYGKEHLHNPHVHIPPGNCLADTEFNIHYHPQVIMEHDRICFKPIRQDMTHSITMMKDVFSNIIAGNSYKSQKEMALKAFGFSYYILKIWLDKIRILYSWTLQITTDTNESRRHQLDKGSDEKDWKFLDYRIGPYYNSREIRKQFMDSDEQTLLNYIINHIKMTGHQLIRLDNMISMFINETIARDHNDLENIIQISTMSFDQEHESYFITKINRNFPSIFENYMKECKKINPLLDQPYRSGLKP